VSKVFLDTNVVLYSIDRSSPRKRDQARELLRAAAEQGNGAISAQVLQEAYVAGTRKLGVDPMTMKQIVASLGNMEVVIVDAPMVQRAIDLAILDQISFWDGLILAAAGAAQCDIVWTEDLSDGQTIGGVRIENPFKARP
jgi:predicted nucleic acid-binding protein